MPIIGVIAGLVCASSAHQSVGSPPVGLNVIIVSIDTLNRSALGAYSATASPLLNLDALASEAVVFSNALSTASWTLPAHASLMTGLLPDRHGATDPRRHLASVTTLAERLYAVGFQTIAFTDGGYVHRTFGFGRGFDRYDDWGSALWPRFKIPRRGRADRTASGDPFDRAVALLSGRRQDDPPLFLFLQTYAVHDYFRPNDQPSRHFECLIGKQVCGELEWNWLRSQYQARVEHVDRAFGRLWDATQHSRDRRPTLLILLSDHGEGLNPESGPLHHGGSLADELIKIPLLVRGPGLSPRRVDTPVSIVDVMPTVLEFVGLKSEVSLDGRSFAEALRGGLIPSRPLLAMEHQRWWEEGSRHLVESPRDLPVTVAIMAEGQLYSVSIGGQRFGPGHGPESHKDPPEHLRRLILDRLRPILGTSQRELSPEVREQLRALGYVQ